MQDSISFDKSKLFWVCGTFLLFIIIFGAFSPASDLFVPASGVPGNPSDYIRQGARDINYTISREFFYSLIPYFLLILALVVVFFRLAYVLYKASMDRDSSDDDKEAGVSAIEFVMALPILVALLLTILQVALLVQAKFVVNYAAFCAVRSAIVVIPARIKNNRLSEDRNIIYTQYPDTSPKMGLIRRAAALPCIAISPPAHPLNNYSVAKKVWFGGVYGEMFTDTENTAKLTLQLGVFIPLDKITDYGIQIGSRGFYAYNKELTKVSVTTDDGKSTNQFAEHGLVTAKVTHKYYLAIPFANRLLGKTFFGGFFGAFFGSGYYREITEEYTLINEGERLYPKDEYHKTLVNNDRYIEEEEVK